MINTFKKPTESVITNKSLTPFKIIKKNGQKIVINVKSLWISVSLSGTYSNINLKKYYPGLDSAQVLYIHPSSTFIHKHIVPN